MSVKVAPATVQDFETFGRLPPYRVRAFAGRDGNGDLIGLGGIAFPENGIAFAWTELTEAARKNPVALHKTALRTLEMARKLGVRRLVATTDVSVTPAGERWLSRLGFKPELSNGVTLWIWRP